MSETFRIMSHAGHNITKPSWDSSVEAVETIVNELATEGCTAYTPTGSQCEKGLGGLVSGHVQYENTEGKTAMFEIVQELPCIP